MSVERADAPGPAPGFEETTVRAAERFFLDGWPDGHPLILVDCTGLPEDVEYEAFSLGGDDDQRDRAMEAVRRDLAAMDIVGVATLIEAWEGDRSDPRRPSEQPGRREVLMVTVEHRGLDAGATRQWRAPARRATATCGPATSSCGCSRPARPPPSPWRWWRSATARSSGCGGPSPRRPPSPPGTRRRAASLCSGAPCSPAMRS